MRCALVTARIKPGQANPLLQAIDAGTLGHGSIAGDEYLDNMKYARDGGAQWVEVCFCATPLQEERSYCEEHFALLSVKNAHARKYCRHKNTSEPWACCNCDCTRRLEQHMEGKGESFLKSLRKQAA